MASPVPNRRQLVSWGWSLLLALLYFSVAWSWSIQPHQRRQRRKISVSTREARGATNLAVRHTLETTLPLSRQGHQETILSPLGWRKPRHNSGSGLLFSEQQTSDWAINDSDLIESIIQANTTREVDQTLRRAYLGNTTTVSLKQEESPFSKERIRSAATHNDGTNKLPLSELSWNVSSALFRRMAHVSVNEARANNNNQLDDSALRQDMLVDLLQRIGGQLWKASRHPPSYDDDNTLDVFALSDILQAFAVLSSGTASVRHKMMPLSMIVVELLDDMDTATLYSIKPIRLVQCLQAMAKLEIRNSSLQRKIFDRLLKSDAVARLPARFLAHGLSAFVSIHKLRSAGPTHGKESSSIEVVQTEDVSIKLLCRAFMRRLRKKNVILGATIEDLTRALIAASDLLKLGAMTGMEDEAAIFGFTGLRQIIQLHIAAKETNDTTATLTTIQVVDLISSWAVVTDRSREDTVIEQLMAVLVDDGILQHCTMTQLVLIIRAIQKLDVEHHAQLAEAVGYRFANLVKESSEVEFEDMDPKLVNEVLRWPILVHRRDDILRPYIDASLELFGQTPFLSRCAVAETSNFLWFLSSAKTFDEHVLRKIGLHLLEPDLVDESSPKMASRIMATFTSLVSRGKSVPSDALVDIQHDLFHGYGGHLLSSSLTPAEITSSLYAYAKASYLQDMGIFDHLVGLLASSRRICTSRQLSQSLWSCGRMAAWENVHVDVEAPGGVSDVPYLSDARLLAEELTTRVEDLTPADIAQTIWAFGRLDIDDDGMMTAFAKQATKCSSRFSTGQITNILWGMAQTQHKDTEVISKLAYQLIAKDVHRSPIEASSALFSLGKLNWRDEVVFDELSSTILEQIEDANAQSIANALWAYRTVSLPAPKELLTTWAIEKIGLQNLSSRAKKDRSF